MEHEEEEKDTCKTSCYKLAQIDDQVFEVVLNTGSLGSLISKGTVDQLGWKIDGPTKLKFNTADGNIGTPLGKIQDAAVKVGGATVSVDFIVTNAKTYDLILGNDWIDKVEAVIDVHRGKAEIKWKGRRWLIPIDIHKGIAPRKIEEESEEESYLME